MEIELPNVAGKKYSYSKKGREQAAAARRKMKKKTASKSFGSMVRRKA
tara:strand:+ start:567 stop:710 length:144 start_codon:yes stop_codon:yes gene_type:complete